MAEAADPILETEGPVELKESPSAEAAMVVESVSKGGGEAEPADPSSNDREEGPMDTTDANNAEEDEQDERTAARAADGGRSENSEQKKAKKKKRKQAKKKIKAANGSNAVGEGGADGMDKEGGEGVADPHERMSAAAAGSMQGESSLDEAYSAEEEQSYSEDDDEGADGYKKGGRCNSKRSGINTCLIRTLKRIIITWSSMPCPAK
jgi:hypothetical protein